MRYGIFSDVHSNTEALDAILSFFRKKEVEEYLCVGDIVGYGAEPHECIEKIRALGGKGIGGNHDWASAGTISPNAFNPYAKAAIVWTRDMLGKGDVGFLKSLESVYTDGTITLVHGSLDFPERFQYIFDRESAAATLELLQTRICFVGHSHLPMIVVRSADGKVYLHGGDEVVLEKDFRYLVNVGSVGQPRDGDPRASCAIFDSERSFVEIKRVSYDIASTQRKIIQAGLPSFLAERLAVGR